MKMVFLILLATTVLVPLVSWEGFMFASTFAKTMLFYMGVQVSLVIWAFVGGWRSLPRNRWLWIFTGLLMASLAVSTLFAYDRGMALWSGYERMMGLVTWLHLFVFFILFVSIRRQDIFFLAAALMAIVVAFIGIGERLFGSDIYSNVESTLHNSAFLGSYLVLSAFFVAWHLMREERFGARAAGWLGGFFVIALTIVFTEARSALMGLAGGGFAIAALIAWKGIEKPMIGIAPQWMRRVAFAVVVIAIVGGIVGSFLFSERLADRTGSARLVAWQVGWEAFKDRPLLGWGPENFSFAFSAHYDPRLFDVEPWFDRAHNLMMDWAVTTGAVGLFAFLAVVGAVFWIMIHKKEYALVGLLAAWFAQNMFTFDILPTYLLLAVAVAYAVEKKGDAFLQKQKGVAFFSGFAALAIALFVSYFVVWQPMRENMIGKQAGEAFAQGEDGQAYTFAEKALTFTTYGDLEVRRLVAEYVFEFIKRGGKRNPDTMTALYDFTLAKMEENSAVQPGEAKWPAYGAALGNLAHAHTKDLVYAERAEAFARKSLALSPGRQQHWLELGQALLVQGKQDDFGKAMERAIALMPRYPIPHLNAAVGAIVFNDRAREEQEIAWLRETTWVLAESARESWDNPTRDWEELVQAYYKAGRLSDAIVYQEMLVETRAQAHDFLQLAALYKKVGRVAEAEQLIRLLDL